MEKQGQKTKGLPRIRISSDQSKTWVQNQARKRVPASHTRQPPALNIRYTAQRVRRRRQRLRAFAITLILHLISIFFLLYYIQPPAVEKDPIFVEWVELLEKRTPKIRKPPRKPQIKATAPGAPVSTQARMKVPVISGPDTVEPPSLTTDTTATDDFLTPNRGVTEVSIPASPTEQPLEPGRYERPGERRTTGGGKMDKGGHGNGSGSEKGGRGTGQDDVFLPPDEALQLANENRVPKDQLGAILEGEGMDIRGHIRIIRLKHSLSDWWQDPTAIPSFAKWLREETQLRVDMTYAGGSLPLTDDRILNAPLIIMTGHNKDIAVGRNLNKEDGPLTGGFTRLELAQLRKYIIERKGMLFFDDCGFNGNFAALAQNELQRALPEYPLRNIDHTHELYTIFYQLTGPPRGGDVFWGNLNRGDSGGYFPGESQFRFQKGITIDRRLAVLYNRKDYMCAMETAEVGSRALLNMRSNPDVHRFMTNLLIYQMLYGGNTDRSGYKR